MDTDRQLAACLFCYGAPRGVPGRIHEGPGFGVGIGNGYSAKLCPADLMGRFALRPLWIIKRQILIGITM